MQNVIIFSYYEDLKYLQHVESWIKSQVLVQNWLLYWWNLNKIKPCTQICKWIYIYEFKTSERNRAFLSKGNLSTFLKLKQQNTLKQKWAWKAGGDQEQEHCPHPSNISESSRVCALQNVIFSLYIFLPKSSLKYHATFLEPYLRDYFISIDWLTYSACRVSYLYERGAVLIFCTCFLFCRGGYTFR